MRAILILAVTMVLCACSVPTAVVRSQVVSYDDAIEDITNKLLVLNILRAKDKAPLHFDEIPSIHETIQATASLTATYPFGPLNKSLLRNTFTPGVTIQMSPSFEIDHLDTKDFVTGLASPIDPKFVKYWLDRGLDRRIVLLLFFSAVDIVGTAQNGKPFTIRIRNSPRDAIDSLLQLAVFSADEASDDSMRCDRQSDFQHYLRFINTLTTFYANSYTERRKLAQGLKLESEASGEKPGPDSAIKNLSSLAALDPTKYQWVRESKTSTYTIYAVSSELKTALCDSGYQLTSPTDISNRPTTCSTSVYDVQTDDPMHAGAAEQITLSFPPVTKAPKMRSQFCEIFDEVVKAKEASASSKDPAAPSDQRGLRLEIRSVGEIIQFLGDLLEYQEELANFEGYHTAPHITLNDPVTFGYCPEGNEVSGCNDIFFNLRSDSCNARFTLTYRNRRYSVPNYNPPDESPLGSPACQADDVGGARSAPARDHTLEVLGVVHQLIDLQKSAQDIRETPYVQLLP